MLDVSVSESVCNTFFSWACEVAISFDWVSDVVGFVGRSVSCAETLVQLIWVGGVGTGPIFCYFFLKKKHGL